MIEFNLTWMIILPLLIIPSFLFCIILNKKFEISIFKSITYVYFNLIIFYLFFKISMILAFIFQIFLLIIFGIILFNMNKEKIKFEEDKLKLIIILFISILIFIAYLSFQNVDYIKGGDSANHILRIIQLRVKNSPYESLGQNNPAYYPLGYHKGVSILTQLLKELPLFLIFKIVNGLIFVSIFLTPLFFYLQTRKNKNKKLYLSTILFSSMLIPLMIQRGNYPMLFSITLSGLFFSSLYKFMNNERNKLVVFEFFLSAALILFTHPVYFQYIFLIAISIFIYTLDFKKIISKRNLYLFFLIAGAFLTSILFCLITDYSLTLGQLNFTTQHSIAQSQQEYSPWHHIIFRENIAQFIILYFNPAVFFFLIFGLIQNFKKDRFMIPMFLANLMILTSQILPLESRAQYVMIIPVTILCSKGYEGLFKSHNLNEQNNNRARKNFRLSFIIISILFFFGYLFFIVSEPKIGALNDMFSSDGFTFINVLKENKINKLIITSTNTPHAKLIEATTNNKVYVGTERIVDNELTFLLGHLFKNFECEKAQKMFKENKINAYYYYKSSSLNKKISNCFNKTKEVSYNNHHLLMINN